MLKNPRVIFLDEPTSGLDASVAQDIASWLHELTRARRTVVATIHQPRLSIFLNMDVVVLMASGEILYSGPPDQAALAFTQVLVLQLQDCSLRMSCFIRAFVEIRLALWFDLCFCMDHC